MQTTNGNISDAYTSVQNACEGLFKDKGSRFISYLYPITSETQVKPLVDAVKKEHHAARHHCFAYRIGHDGAVFRANDDGEPSGSAGRPILGAIDSAGLSDVLVVVVRYFGGILLGVPGLINAYKEATRDAIGHAVTVQKIACRQFQLEFEYLQMNDAQRFLKSEELTILDQQFDLNCRMTVSVRLALADSFIPKIEKMNREKGTNIICKEV